jgi:Golgi apparatus protein 1
MGAMMSNAFRLPTRVALLLAAIAVSSVAHAQTDVTAAILQKLTARIQQLENSCGEDIRKYCVTVTPGEGRILHCMQAHEDKISPKCAFDLREAELDIQATTEQLQQATNACRGDIDRLCGKTEPGQGRIAACLAAQAASVSPSCTAAVQKLHVK